MQSKRQALFECGIYTDIDFLMSLLDLPFQVLTMHRAPLSVARYGGLGTSAGALAGLKQLNALLFGDARVPPPGEDADSRGTLPSDPLVDVNVFRQCMNLRANVEDYYNPSNLYLNDVLDSRKGVEIR